MGTEAGVAEDRGLGTGRQTARTTENKGDRRGKEKWGGAVKTAQQAEARGLEASPERRKGPEQKAAATSTIPCLPGGSRGEPGSTVASLGPLVRWTM